MGDTAISWTDKTWNPTTGCSKVSPGCDHCYAEALSLKRGWSKLPWTGPNAAMNVILHPDRLSHPFSWRGGCMVFVNSMSDLFHERVPDEFIAQVFSVMERTPQHTYQVLTKREERLAHWRGPWPPNVWAGVSVEDRRRLVRLDSLRRCGALMKFVSFEPLLEDLGHIDLRGIDWVIVGGESGPGFREMDLDWARGIRDQAVSAGVTFFYKQGSGIRSGMHVKLDGKIWHEWPGTIPQTDELDLFSAAVTHGDSGAS